MKIKEPYMFIVKQNGKRYSLIMGTLFLAALLFSIIFSTVFSTQTSFISMIEDSFPSLQTFSLILFIFSWISYLSNMYLGNQLGRSRTTMFISSILSYSTIILIVSLLFALAGISFYHDSEIIQLFGLSDRKGVLFIKEFLWVFTSLLNMYALSQFICAIWARTTAIMKVVIFIVIPVFLSISIPKIIFSYSGSYEILQKLYVSISNFFGYANNSIQIGRVSITTIFVIVVPLLVFSYLLSRGLEFKSKKTH